MECGRKELEPSKLSDTVWRSVEGRTANVAGMVKAGGRMRVGLVVEGSTTEARDAGEGVKGWKERRPGGPGPRIAGGLRRCPATERRRPLVMLTRAADAVAADAVCGG